MSEGWLNFLLILLLLNAEATQPASLLTAHFPCPLPCPSCPEGLRASETVSQSKRSPPSDASVRMFHLSDEEEKRTKESVKKLQNEYKKFLSLGLVRWLSGEQCWWHQPCGLRCSISRVFKGKEKNQFLEFVLQLPATQCGTSMPTTTHAHHTQ